ncbi:MAG: VWA domain-containing protein [Sphingobacteriales bacterium]|jgi:Ca-activated chloride channel family protein|nr:VWA domain-containing protein [Sphingobacteriales bacterium]MBP9140566.1 VWA domain-containing protein [Chitinophagales bacterium]MDA0197254.1 VWA domain-containing protein [Bacteroidota bacterium]MBK6890364.1 VWA domain-containing protein [Sphingobacteriales bacterium]MBK7526583.1 VWA domain-containing protein [Sphingobacteriales bacterium]
MFSAFAQTTFVHPWFLLLLILLPFFWWWHYKRNKNRQTSLLLPTAKALLKQPKTWLLLTQPWLYSLRLLAFACLAVAMARPQTVYTEHKVNAQGIDIIISTDVSSSMLARDFTPDRLQAAKIFAAEFIKKRPYDRIGLVVFSGESFTQCPLTTDHRLLQTLLGSIKSGAMADGTAIGMGLATAVDRLKDSEAKSKVVILLTDGVNNAGAIQPLTAASIAQALGIKVYTIGVGTKGMAPYPMPGFFGMTLQQVLVEIDEALLQEIADKTNGKYFRATDNDALRRIYDQIDQLEKTKIEQTTITKHIEKFFGWVIIALVLLLVEFLLRKTLFRSLVE